MKELDSHNLVFGINLLHVQMECGSHTLSLQKKIHQSFLLLFVHYVYFQTESSSILWNWVHLVIISSKHLWFFEVIEKEYEPPITRLENAISRECDSCLGVEEIQEYLITLFDHMIENITFNQWTNVDRSSLETITMLADEFVELFSEKLEAPCPHSFIATKQSRLFSECKSTLKPGEIVVSADFSENNYTFVFQDAAQGFHWNNAQATIHLLLYITRNQEKSTIWALW